jgi:spermidine synthase
MFAPSQLSEKAEQLKEVYQKTSEWGLWTNIAVFRGEFEQLRDKEVSRKWLNDAFKGVGDVEILRVVDFSDDEESSEIKKETPTKGFSVVSTCGHHIVVSAHFNTEEKKGFIDIFSPKWYDSICVVEATKTWTKSEETSVQSALRSERWFEEAIEFLKGSSLKVKITKKLYSTRSKFQEIEVYETVPFGNMLVIDGVIMLTEWDEFAYHEMITHVPLCTHPNPKRVLVVGAGDGGVLREVLKHTSLELIDHCEIDSVVCDVCKEYFPYVASGLDDPKINFFDLDATKFVKDKTDYYDVIIVDSTDPFGPGAVLFEKAFFEDCCRALTEDGILVTQAESIFLHLDFIKNLVASVRDLFSIMKYYTAMVPTYPSGVIGFTFSSKKYHPIKDFKDERVEKLGKLVYYNKDIHRAAFALPTFARELSH